MNNVKRWIEEQFPNIKKTYTKVDDIISDAIDRDEIDPLALYYVQTRLMEMTRRAILDNAKVMGIDNESLGSIERIAKDDAHKQIVEDGKRRTEV